ncbi:MAG: DEAD/DEAH box helicase [Micavibrio sp.]|nr:DEAD/DEAH box helicase [Micavibrio sp.]
MIVSSKFYTNVKDNSVEISLREKRGILKTEFTIPAVEWQNVLPQNYLPILAVVDDLIENFDGIRSENFVILSHESIVTLSEAQATLLGFPPSIPFAFDIRANGMIDQKEFSLSTSWVTPGGVRELVTRKGAFAFKGQEKYRIPSPIFEIVKAAEVLSGMEANDNARYQALAALHEALPKDENQKKIRLDKFLGSIRVLHASSFSLQIPTNGEGFQFNPVLFSRKAMGRAEEDERILDEAENLLTPVLQHTFAENRFKLWDEVRDCYTVDNGFYVYVDPDLKKALGVVRKMQKASPEERRNFIRSPQRIIREQLGDDIELEIVERVFVETEQYAQNVVGLGIWEPPVIPWLKKEPNSWLPEKFGLKIGDIYVQIRPEDIVPLRDEITKKLSTNGMNDHIQETIKYVSEDGPVEIPITNATKEILGSLVGYATAVQLAKEKQDYIENIPPEINDLLEDKAGIFFLLTEDNIDDIRYKIEPTRRALVSNYREPLALKSSLKIHQKEGLKWLIDAWTQGAPGVLLADDMGLGKTLQALTFLAWIKERKEERHLRCREPVLIVAPTGLLNNWQREIEIHLREPYLGEKGICKAYGNGLSSVRINKKNDLLSGQVNLSRDELRKFDVVLTTYETYRDYHHSFAGIKFSAVVMDECQKIKNPKSQVNRALASMNAEFVIAMTGTPIENAMEDLWTILDRAWPGFLGDLKSFSSTYSPDNREALTDLTNRLKRQASPEITTPILWRRMKEDILDDLPRKIIHPAPPYDENWWLQSDMVVNMPPEQADAYLQVVTRAKELKPPPMLHTLHALRGISLHPINPSDVLKEANFVSYDSYIKGSARLSKTIEILDKIRSKNEKSLLFIETLDMQTLMAEILKKRYGLSKRPSIINGKTGVDRIQRLVDDFQNDSNFDVMILSLRLVGLD